MNDEKSILRPITWSLFPGPFSHQREVYCLHLSTCFVHALCKSVADSMPSLNRERRRPNTFQSLVQS